jgi:hypothetical protein
LVKNAGLPLESNKKDLAIKPVHEGREDQFEHINQKASTQMKLGVSTTS